MLRDANAIRKKSYKTSARLMNMGSSRYGAAGTTGGYENMRLGSQQTSPSEYSRGLMNSTHTPFMPSTPMVSNF